MARPAAEHILRVPRLGKQVFRVPTLVGSFVGKERTQLKSVLYSRERGCGLLMGGLVSLAPNC